MSAVGHYLEEGGVPTASISLVREHSEAMEPPRALWVPFMLGRPLGAPNDAAFQRLVLRALLSLFDADEGPVLHDFTNEAPHSDPADNLEGAACPVNFARPRPSALTGAELSIRLRDEIDELRPWHDLSVQRRGGTGVGLSGLTTEQAGEFLYGFVCDQQADDLPSGQPLSMALKHACDDIRTYYEEAAAAQPGGLGAAEVQDWFYLHTVAGQLLQAVREKGLIHSDRGIRAMSDRTLIPRAILNRPPKI